MAFPSIITSFTNPTPNDRLNSPSHSSIETAQNTGLTEIQTFIGTTASSAVGTILYDVRSPDSNGGGHVQTTDKGGTGQTTFNKGDVLVAQNSSTLSKLAVGTQEQILQVNSSTATGLQWGTAPARPKVAVSGSVQTLIGSLNVFRSVLGVSIPASTLGTNNAIRARIFVEMGWNNSAPGFRWNAHYGTSLIGTVEIQPPGGNINTSIKGCLDVNILGGNSVSNQSVSIIPSWVEFPRVTSILLAANQPYMAFSILGVDSDHPRNLDIGAQIFNTVTGASIVTRGYTVEKLT